MNIPASEMGRSGILRQESQLTAAELATLAPFLPGREPVLVPRADGTVIPIAGTRLDGNELAYVTECLESGWISSQGPFIGRFEAAFAEAVGVRHAVACSSGTAALHLALAAFGVGPGDEVIIPTSTMVAVANAVTYTGATPVLLDADRATWNMDVGGLEAAVTPRTRGIVAVHTYGRPAEMAAIRAVAARHGLFVLEDAAEAHGATLDGRTAGAMGDAGAFSFYANKIVTTGDGGMVTTDDAAFARLVRTLRDHAFSEERHFWHRHVAYNYRMSSLQAAVGLAQVERLAELVALRRAHDAAYRRHLAGTPGLTLPAPDAPGAHGVAWMHGLLVEDAFGRTRDELRACLAAAGIETRTFFVPIHAQPIYYHQYRGQLFPVAEELSARGLCLPSGPGLSEEDIACVAAVVRGAGRRAAP